MVGAGVNQSYPDPDVIPPALIERVDVLTDGGSAIYGADAVGGVINFITKKNFDGLDVGVREGLGARSYRSTDVNVTAGKTWDSGSLYIGYNYSKHDPIYGSERGYVRNINYATGLPAAQSVQPPQRGRRWLHLCCGGWQFAVAEQRQSVRYVEEFCLLPRGAA